MKWDLCGTGCNQKQKIVGEGLLNSDDNTSCDPGVGERLRTLSQQENKETFFIDSISVFKKNLNKL